MSQETVNKNIIEDSEKYHNTFYVASRVKRVMASFIDFLCALVLALILITALEGTLKNSKAYSYQNNILLETQSKCSLFVENGYDYITVIQQAKDKINNDEIGSEASYEAVNLQLERSLKGFYEDKAFFKDGKGGQIYKDLKIGSNKITFTNDSGVVVPYFLDNKGEPEFNSAVTQKQLFQFYNEAYSNYAMPTLNTNYPQYLEATRLTFIYIVLHIAGWWAFSLLIFFWVVPSFDRRTHKTVGKWLLKLGVVNRDGYACTFWHFFARSAFEYLIELLLSLVSFFIPFAVSYGFVTFRKDAGALHDYICGTHVIDTDNAYVYLDKDEQKKRKEKMENVSLTISKR